MRRGLKGRLSLTRSLSELLQRCDLVRGPYMQQLLVPASRTEQQKPPFKFNATLAQDFIGTANLAAQ